MHIDFSGIDVYMNKPPTVQILGFHTFESTEIPHNKFALDGLFSPDGCALFIISIL
jgi:hypothetical protein